MPNFNSNFILGSTIFQPSALKEYDASRCLINQFVKTEHEEAVAALRSLPPRKVKQQAPSNSSIVPGIKLIGDLEHDSVRKLQETVFYIPLKGQPFLNFKEQLEIEQTHGMKYSGAYENEKACKNFIVGTVEYFL